MCGSVRQGRGQDSSVPKTVNEVRETAVSSVKARELNARVRLGDGCVWVSANSFRVELSDATRRRENEHYPLAWVREVVTLEEEYVFLSSLYKRISSYSLSHTRARARAHYLFTKVDLPRPTQGRITGHAVNRAPIPTQPVATQPAASGRVQKGNPRRPAVPSSISRVNWCIPLYMHNI